MMMGPCNDIYRSHQPRCHQRKLRHPRGPASARWTLRTSLLLALIFFTASSPSAAGQNSTAIEACPTPLANGGKYTVSSTAGATELSAALASCTGGSYDVTWSGAVTLAQPLVVANQSSLTITGLQGESGAPAALDGNNATGLVDLGEESLLRLDGVILRNARRASGNGGAVRADMTGCSISAVGSTFESNMAVALGYNEGKGGALALGAGATAELENCTIVGNHAEGTGGGVSVLGDDSSVWLKGCVLEDNASEREGGAVHVYGRSTVTLVTSSVSNNFAQEEGGALFGLNATVIVRERSTFVNNTVVRAGAGISLFEDSSLNITHSTFATNHVYSDGTFAYGTGGAVRVQGDTPNSLARVFVADSVFEGNAAPSGGAIWAAYGFRLTVERTDFRDSEAWSAGGLAMGGAVAAETDGVASFFRCTFSRGWGFHGGGAIMAEDCRVNVTECDFDQNNGSFEAGALYLRDNSETTLVRSTFTNNYINTRQSEGGSGAAISATSATLSVSECMFENNQAGYEEGANSVELMGGGAVQLDDSSNASFSTCNFTGNGGALGGAILAAGYSSVNLTNVFLLSNQADLSGGALSFIEGSSFLMRDSHVAGNSAGVRAGALYLESATGDLIDVTFADNRVSAGSGGALALWEASNATITRGYFGTNSVSDNGGHIFAKSAHTNIALYGPLILTGGNAGSSGGAVYVSSGAAVSMTDVELSHNRAEGGNGGALHAVKAGLTSLSGCNVTANSCTGSGGGISVTGTEFFGNGTNFAENEAGSHGGGLHGFTDATVEIENCRFFRNSATLGGGLSNTDSRLVATRCEVTRNTATTDGGGVRLSYQTTGWMESCNVSFNAAGVDGGAIAVDASSDTTDGSLSLTNASSTFLCHEGRFEGNQAEQRGGAVYVTRESDVTWDGCHSTKNTASLGASIYASHSMVKIVGGTALEYDEVPTGAMIYGARTRLEAHNSSWLAKDAPSLLAVQMTSGSSMRALACSFQGFIGPYVVHTGGLLEMDLCDFRGSQAEVFVAATNASLPARVRNTALGIESYDALSSGEETSLSINVDTCDNDPCGTYGQSTETRFVHTDGGDDFTDQSCVDGNLGVYCPCFQATVTGDEECLGEDTMVTLEGPDVNLLAVGINGMIESSLDIMAGSDGGVLVWKVEEVVGPYSVEGLTWTVVPNVGILEEGGLATVSITGQLNSNLNGLTFAQFRVVSLQSGDSDTAMVNTTFYFCRSGSYYDGSNCIDCSSVVSDGLDCGYEGLLLTTLPLSDGYWRATDNSTNVRECHYEEACVGGTVIETSNDYCAAGYEGPYCAVCSESYAGGISNGCHRCSQSFKAGMYCLAAVGLLLGMGFLWLLTRYLIQAPSSTRHLLSWRNSLIVKQARKLPLYKLKIPIVVFQIITQYADITTVEFPPSFAKFLSYVDVFNLDAGWLLSASCIFTADFYGRLLLTTLGPLALTCGLTCTFIYARSQVITTGLPKRSDSILSSRSDATMSETRQLSVVKRRHMAVLVTMTFLFYSTVSTIVFQTFACDHLEELNESYLRADYSLVCHTSKHNWYKIYASVMILVYPVGIPLLYAFLLFKHRHRIYPRQALRDGVSPERRLGDKKIAHTILLWEAYRPSRYYYEVVECFRRLLLTGCLVFILPNSAGQAAVACTLSVFSVCVFITLRPFSDPNDDRLYVLGCTIVFMSMFVSLVPKVSIASGDDESQTVMSWLLIALSVGMGLMAVAQCFWEVRAVTKGSLRSDSEDTSPGIHLMGPGPRGEEKSEASSGYKNSTPGNPNTGNRNSSDLFDFLPNTLGSGASGGKEQIASIGENYHRSGSSAGTGSVRATGYAEPVPQFEVGGSGGGNGGGAGASAADSATSNVSQSSGNTYGPLKDVIVGGGGGAEGGGGGGGGEFPPVNVYDDVVDSPTMAEEMFARRVAAAGTAGGNGRRWNGGRRSRDEEQKSSSAAEYTGATGSAGSAGAFGGGHGVVMYPDFVEHGGEEGPRRAVLRLSPAEPMTNAFPAPMTNAFPASTDTPEGEQPGRSRGQALGGAVNSLSPSPASSGVTFKSGHSRRQLLGPSPAASDFMPGVREDVDGASGSGGAPSAATVTMVKPRRSSGGR